MALNNRSMSLKSICTANEEAWPWRRSGHTMVAGDNYDIYLYGGYNPNYHCSLNSDYPRFTELWKYCTITNKWYNLPTTGSVPIYCASHCSFFYNEKLWIFGGTSFPFGKEISNLLYCCDLKRFEWSIVNCTGDTVNPSYGSACALDNDTLWLMLGTSGYIYHNDLYSLDLKNFHWTLHKQTSDFLTPSSRYRHEIIIYNGDILLFGGGTQEKCFDFENLMVFNIKEKKWSIKPCYSNSKNIIPRERYCHSVSKWKNYCFLLGGINKTRIYDDFWQFNMDTFTWTKLKRNPLYIPTYFHSSTVTPQGEFFSFGGTMRMDAYSAEQGINSLKTEFRSDRLYKLELEPLSLQELSIKYLLNKFKTLFKLSDFELKSLGISKYFREIIAECNYFASLKVPKNGLYRQTYSLILDSELPMNNIDLLRNAEILWKSFFLEDENVENDF